MKITAATCPNCGAQIDVDENSNSTKCNYCNSQIIVEEAIQKYKLEISGEVEVKNIPKLDNLLKIAERHYRDHEYQEAYSAYSKTLELDPDNSIAILRKGISKALCTNYLDFEIELAVNGMKNAYSILSKNPEKNKEKINGLTIETSYAIKKLEALIINFYNKSGLSVEGVSEFHSKLNLCLEAYEYLTSIIFNDNIRKAKIIDNSIACIDIMMENRKYRNKNFYSNGEPMISIYKINTNQKKILLNKKQELINKKAIMAAELQNNERTSSSIVSNANTSNNEISKGITQKKYDALDILSYIAVSYFVISAGSSFLDSNLAVCCLWILSALIFIPAIKQKILEMFSESEMSAYFLIIMARICLPVIAFALMGSSTSDYNNYSYNNAYNQAQINNISVSENVEANSIKASNEILLVDGELGEYGVNIKADNSTYIHYYVPAGEYKITNKGNQCFVYIDKNKATLNSSGYTEFTNVRTIDFKKVGEADTIVILSDEHIFFTIGAKVLLEPAKK